MKTKLTELQKQKLIETATQAVDKAYAPYSKFRVGAAVLTTEDKIIAGCNVENASYGLSLCAERNAIANAIMGREGDKIEIRAIAIANGQKVPCSPCGACRQVIWEFGQQAEVIFQGNEGWQSSAIKELLPEGFSF